MTRNGNIHAMLESMGKKAKKSAAAVALGKKRWKGVPAAERSEIARRAIAARWSKRRKEA